MVVYSLASPVRKMPETVVIRSALKPIGETYTSTAVDTNKDAIIEASVEPATGEEEIEDTVTVMGGEDWELDVHFLKQIVLADGCKTVA